MPAEHSAETSTRAEVTVHMDNYIVRKIVSWYNEFYSDPLNRLAYASWCAANGYDYDLPDDWI